MLIYQPHVMHRRPIVDRFPVGRSNKHAALSRCVGFQVEEWRRFGVAEQQCPIQLHTKVITGSVLWRETRSHTQGLVCSPLLMGTRLPGCRFHVGKNAGTAPTCPETRVKLQRPDREDIQLVEYLKKKKKERKKGVVKPPLLLHPQGFWEVDKKKKSPTYGSLDTETNGRALTGDYHTLSRH